MHHHCLFPHLKRYLKCFQNYIFKCFFIFKALTCTYLKFNLQWLLHIPPKQISQSLLLEILISISKRNKIQTYKITLTFKLTAALFILASKQKQPKCPPTGEEINKLWYQHTVNQDKAKSKNKLQVPAITQTNLTDVPREKFWLNKVHILVQAQED